MLEPLGIGVGDPAGAVVAAPVVAWTAELAAGVDGVLEQAADRLASTSAGSSRRLWWHLMANSMVKGGVNCRYLSGPAPEADLTRR